MSKKPNPGARLASLRRRVKRTCVVCGKAYTGLTTKLTCSDACRSSRSRAGRRAPPSSSSGPIGY